MDEICQMPLVGFILLFLTPNDVTSSIFKLFFSFTSLIVGQVGSSIPGSIPRRAGDVKGSVVGPVKVTCFYLCLRDRLNCP